MKNKMKLKSIVFISDNSDNSVFERRPLKQVYWVLFNRESDCR